MPLSAHHSWPVSYTKLVTVKGTVTEFTWANPHPMMTLEVQTDAGRTEKWLIGGPAINRMEANGWTRTTVKPGDMLAELVADNKKVAQSMRECHEVCDKHGDVATASILENFIDEAERRVWFMFEASRKADQSGH